MTKLEPINRAITFIEDHLRTAINVAAMAEVAAYSLYHFCRMFSKYTRHTPYDYLIRRRMTLAAHDVIMTDRKIVDIALEYQFESHEGFTRAFQRIFGTAPTNARAQRVVPASRCLPRLTDDHLICLQRQHGLAPEFVTLPESATSSAASIHDCNSLAGNDEVLRIAVPRWWPVSAAEAREPDSAPLPAGNYACFTLSHVPDDIPLAVDWVLHAWLFYAPHTLRVPCLGMRSLDDAHGHLYAPII